MVTKWGVSLIRSHRFAFALCVLFAHATSFAHLAISDHTLSASGHLFESCPPHEAAPEGLNASAGTSSFGSDERCVVFEAAQTAVELVALPVSLELEGTQLLAAGSVRRGFVRNALIDAPKASPPSRV